MYDRQSARAGIPLSCESIACCGWSCRAEPSITGSTAKRSSRSCGHVAISIGLQLGPLEVPHIKQKHAECRHHPQSHHFPHAVTLSLLLQEDPKSKILWRGSDLPAAERWTAELPCERRNETRTGGMPLFSAAHSSNPLCTNYYSPLW